MIQVKCGKDELVDIISEILSHVLLGCPLRVCLQHLLLGQALEVKRFA